MTTPHSLPAMLPDEEAVRILVSEYLPLVEVTARRIALTMPRRVEFDDLLQNGVIGLIEAARRFDPSRGIKFETFAEQRVRGAMVDELRKESWPRGIRRFRRLLENAQRDLRAQLNADPDTEQLAAHLGMSEKRYRRWIVRLKMIESTSDAYDEEAYPILPEAFVPPESPPPDRVLDRRELHRAIRQLPPRERRVVVEYYFNGLTFKLIGELLGVGESRVSQIHGRATRYLCRILSGEKLIFAKQGPGTTVLTTAEQRKLTLRLLARRRIA